MRKIDPKVQNTLMLIANEHVRQLEHINPKMSVVRKQQELRQIMAEVILLAKTAPKGQIEIIFAGKDYGKKTRPVQIMDEALQKFVFFNTVERKGVMMRTVIVIDPLWSDNFKVFHCQYGFSDLNLKENEDFLKRK
jgi:hypothetical protein